MSMSFISRHAIGVLIVLVVGALVLARAHGAGELDGPAVKQKLFSQGRLAGVRVRDDRERAALRHVAHVHVAFRAQADAVFVAFGSLEEHDRLDLDAHGFASVGSK